MQTSLQVVS